MTDPANARQLKSTIQNAFIAWVLAIGMPVPVRSRMMGESRIVSHSRFCNDEFIKIKVVLELNCDIPITARHHRINGGRIIKPKPSAHIADVKSLAANLLSFRMSQFEDRPG